MKKIKYLIYFIMALWIVVLFDSCPLFNNSEDVINEAGTIIGKLLRAGNKLTGKYMVIAVDTITGNTFHGFTNANGAFSINLKSNTHSKGINAKDTGDGTFIVSIVGDDGRTIGTVTYGNSGSDKTVTGIKVDANSGVDYGTINIPQDPTKDPIAPDNDVSSLADSTVTARADTNGVPVGIDSLGKGDDDTGTATTPNSADTDGDGLVNVLDADDDGDGIADDFDSDTETDSNGNSLFKVSISQLLDIESIDYVDYYNTTDSPNYDALVRDLRLDILVEPKGTLEKPIVKVEIMEQPGPTYLPDLLAGPANNPYNWKGSGYTLTPSGDSGGYGVNLMFPNGSTSFFEAGDSFLIKVWQGDNLEDPNATYTVLSAMLNYVFNYPSSYRFTSDPDPNVDPDTVVEYVPDPNNPDITFDGTKSEFVFIMAPPKDEEGNPITTGGTFELHIAYEKAEGQIYYLDEDALVQAAGNPQGWDGTRYTVSMENLNYDYTSAPNPNTEMLFKVRVPMEMLPDTVTEWDDEYGTNPTENVSVTSYGLGTRFIIRDSIAQNSISMKKILN